MTPEFAHAFAEEWIAAWNKHDLDRILSHYTDDFTMSSPIIVERMGEPSGTLHGKAAIREYWTRGLAALPDLRFDLEQVLIGAESVALLYRRKGGPRAVEVFFFESAGPDAGRVKRAAAHYA
jgi:ketosteroid isomerase-like protein